MSPTRFGGIDMVEQDGVSPLIARLYEAALRLELWDSALERISNALGGAGLNIPIIDSAHNARFFLGTTRLDPELGERFLNNPLYVEPTSKKWMNGLTGPPAGRVFHREEVLTDREYRATPIFNDITHPQKLWHWAFAPLILTQDMFVPLGVLRPAGPPLFDAEASDLLSRLLPHLVRPESATVRRSPAPCAAAPTLTRPPAGVCRTAFTNRFSRMRPTISGSKNPLVRPHPT